MDWAVARQGNGPAASGGVQHRRGESVAGPGGDTGVSLPGYSDAQLVRQTASVLSYDAYNLRAQEWREVTVGSQRLPEGTARYQFRQQCELASTLAAHPYMSRIYEFALTPDGRPYVASELTDAGTVADAFARQGGMPVPLTLHVGVCLAGALHAVHSADVVHCHVEPGTILLRSNGEPLLSGLANPDDQDPSTMPTYAAPELRSGGTVSPAADVYSLAGVLYTLLQGAEPQMGQVLSVLQQGRAQHPAHRPPLPGLVQALQQAQSQLGVPITEPVLMRLGSDGVLVADHQTSPGQQAPGSPPPVNRSSQESPPRERTGRARRLLFGAGIGAAAAGVAVGGFFALSQLRDSNEEGPGTTQGGSTTTSSTSDSTPLDEATTPEIPTGLTATDSEVGVQLDWEGDDDQLYAVALLPEGQDPTFLPPVTGSSHLVPSSELDPALSYCFAVARTEDVAASTSNDEGAMAVFSEPTCPGG